MQPTIHVLGISIKTFGICFALGFLGAGAIMTRRLRELGKSPDWAYEIVFAALVGGLVGARLYYLLQHPHLLSDDPWGSVFGGSGLVWYGGLLGGALAVVVWAWRRDWLGVAVLDLCALPLALGYAIGRIGCQVSGDGDYGKPSHLPWAMAYPHGTVPTTVRVQPTPIYETVAMGLLTWVLWRFRDRLAPGCCSPGISSGRHRAPRRRVLATQPPRAARPDGPQLESIGLMVAGIVWLALARRRAVIAAA